MTVKIVNMATLMIINLNINANLILMISWDNLLDQNWSWVLNVVWGLVAVYMDERFDSDIALNAMERQDNSILVNHSIDR